VSVSVSDSANICVAVSVTAVVSVSVYVAAGPFVYVGELIQEVANDDPWGRRSESGWEDSFAEMRVLLPIQAQVHAAHVCVKLTATHLLVAVHAGGGGDSGKGRDKGDGEREDEETKRARGLVEQQGEETVVLNVDLFGSVDVASSWWQVRRTYTHTNLYAHMCTHTHTNTYILAHTLSHTLRQTHMHTQTYMLTNTNVLTHEYTHMNTHTQTHMHACK